MRVSIDHPTNRPNFTEVTLGDVTVWFSYRTPIAFVAPGHPVTVRENDWGLTTGKHLNHLNYGPDGRIPGAEFQQRLDSVLSAMQTV
jgi:hypothetical protein